MSHTKTAVTDAILNDLEHPLGCARNRDDHDCTCGLEDQIEEDGFVTVHCTAPQPPCPVCHGKGKVAVAGTQNGVDYDTTDDCPNCSEPLKIGGVWRRQF